MRSRSLSRRARLPAGIRTGRCRPARRNGSGQPKSAAPRRRSSPTERSSRRPSTTSTRSTNGLQELAFLNSGVRIRFHDTRVDEGDEFYYERGIIEFVEHLNRASDALHQRCDLLLRRSGRNRFRNRDAVHGRVHGKRAFVRQQHQHDRRRYARLRVPFRPDPDAEQLRQEGEHLQGPGADRRRFPRRSDGGDLGSRAASAVRRPDEDQAGQQRSRRHRRLRPSARRWRNTWRRIPRTAKTIVRKGVLAAEAREAARKAKDVLRKRKNVLGGGGLPGKLRDCISKEMETMRVVPGRR